MCMSQRFSVMIPHVLTRIESWACICMCFHNLRAWYASAGFRTIQELSMYQHELAGVEAEHVSQITMVFAYKLESKIRRTAQQEGR